MLNRLTGTSMQFSPVSVRDDQLTTAQRVQVPCPFSLFTFLFLEFYLAIPFREKKERKSKNVDLGSDRRRSMLHADACGLLPFPSFWADIVLL